MTINKTEILRKSFAADLQDAHDQLAKFAEELLKHPTYAMTWGDRAVTAAGSVAVAEKIVELLDSGVEHGKVHEFAVSQALRAARFPARSTSPMNNLTEQAVAQAWAMAAERLQRY